MIEKIDIESFGIYQGYEWNKCIGADKTFNKINLLYGRNYSGKTTLSRIFGSFDTALAHPDFEDGKFSIKTTDGTISQTDIPNTANLSIRVYNSDFVKRNLSWLHKPDGTISPFTVLGDINIEYEKRIREIDESLGNEELGAGLIHNLAELRTAAVDANKKRTSKENELTNKLKSKANDEIKLDRNLFVPSTSKKTYQINDIYNDIDKVKNDLNKQILPEETVTSLKNLLSEKTKDVIATRPEKKPNFSLFLDRTNALITKKIKPSVAISELINDNILQKWVKSGIELHKGKKPSCGFCGSDLSASLWGKLDAHFNEESEELTKSIAERIDEIIKAKNGLNSFSLPVEDNIYSKFRLEFHSLASEWKDAQIKYQDNLDCLSKELAERASNIFQDRQELIKDDNSDEILNIIVKFNVLINKNNQQSNDLTSDQTKARNSLRLSVVATFIHAIDLKQKLKDIEALEKDEKSVNAQITELNEKIQNLIEEKRRLKSSLQDESKGAELVNEYLERYFGHNEFKLEATEEVDAAAQIRFQIRRGDKLAKNLSEGECSLISFCYYLAKIKDELSGGNLTLYIDDPISSLDSNHVFFVFSLIESLIAKPAKYGQLFISTHNLDFFKYLKRLSTPGNKEAVSYYIIERLQKKNEKNCFIKTMPTHLRDFVTEYHYLFNEIYAMYKVVNGDRSRKIENSYNQFYNLPNNMRKFLECYLFYKYPNSNNPLENLDKLFDNNTPCLVNRVVNEYSHLTYIERGWKPVDVHEIEECAKHIIEKIREKDEDQYHALVASIN